jgi:uncharacterized membrane-anchored protein YhcB (DUF1043 family)
MFWLGLCIGLAVGASVVLILLYQNRELRAFAEREQKELKQKVQEIRETLRKEHE